jgi:hypothetical protein
MWSNASDSLYSTTNGAHTSCDDIEAPQDFREWVVRME